MVVENLPLSFRFTQMEISTLEASLAAFFSGTWNVSKRIFFVTRGSCCFWFFLQNFHSVRNKERYVMIKHRGQFAHIPVEI